MEKMENINVGKHNINIDGELTPKQREQIIKFLEEKKSQEKAIIVSITKQEIADLRLAIESNNLNKFLEKNQEGLKQIEKSSDILSGTLLEKNFGDKESFEKFTNTIDKGVYNFYFGNDGLLKGINISENQKKSFSVGSSIFIMDLVYNEIKKTGNVEEIMNELQKILGGNGKTGSLEQLGKNLSSGDSVNNTIEIVKNLVTGDITKLITKIYKPENIQNIKDAILESETNNNLIFSNPAESFDFFENAYNNNLNKDEIKKIIQSKTSENGIGENDISKLKKVGDKIGEIMTPEIGNSLSSISNIVEFFEKGKEKIKDSIIGNNEILGVVTMLSQIPIIGDIVKSFLNFLNIDLDKVNNSSEKNLEEIKKEILKKDSFLEEAKITDNFGKNSNGEIDNDFIENIISISGGEEEFKKNTGNIFQKGNDFEKFFKNEKLKEITDFGRKNILTNNNGEIIFENLKYLTSLYKEFLEAKQNQEVNSIDDFVDKKSLSDKQLNKQIFAGTENSGETINDQKQENNQNQTKIKNTNDNKQETSKSTEQSPKENKDLIISGNEGIEINNEKASYIFTLNGKKYEISVWKNGYITLVEDRNKKVVYQGGNEFFNLLSKFNGKLDDKAKAGDFGRKGAEANVELNGKSIREILINGLNEKVSYMGFSKDVNEKGLKDLIPESFFNNGKIIEGNISLSFGGKNYNLVLAQKR
ncbi:hypothetical protein DLH72_01765 [Candidatus Gracilibacteria bacterium]|nr:MAG: hypothetical protein DLH72_01765 [Candidatus Gracilibacteria bacterium]